MLGAFGELVPFTRLFYGVHSSFYYQHGRHVEGVPIIKSFLGMKKGDPLGGPLFTLARHRTFLKTIAHVLNCVFPSLTDDSHIVRPMNEITCAFDHLLTQLALIALRVKVSNYKL